MSNLTSVRPAVFSVLAMLLGLAIATSPGCGGLFGKRGADRYRLDAIAALRNQGNDEAALQQLQSYLADYPQHDLAWVMLGNLHDDAGRLIEAEKAFQEALAVNNNSHQAWTGLGIIHRRQGDYNKAAEAYLRAIDLEPTYAQAYSALSIIALGEGDDAEALKLARQAYELDSSSPEIAANLSAAYHYNGDLENRDLMFTIARNLGFENVEAQQEIFAGTLTLRFPDKP